MLKDHKKDCTYIDLFELEEAESWKELSILKGNRLPSARKGKKVSNNDLYKRSVRKCSTSSTRCDFKHRFWGEKNQVA